MTGGRIDPSRPYLCRLASGRKIVLFFYDGPISRAVAFEMLLEMGENFAERLSTGFSETRDWHTDFNEDWSFNDKSLIFNIHASHPVNSLIRLQKFIKSGWEISDEELIKIALAINNLIFRQKNIRSSN